MFAKNRTAKILLEKTRKTSTFAIHTHAITHTIGM
jgi:hypothetical protein